MNSSVTIIGGGLAGSEAAWQLARRGCRVILYEMKPVRYSPAHTSSMLAELVCSNSFRSDAADSAVGLLKEEMRRLDSLIMTAAGQTRVPAGKALAVDRERFAAFITDRLEKEPLINIVREEMKDLRMADETSYTILATGPLTSDSLAASLREITGHEQLSFYDAIAPIVAAESLNMDIVYQASRYDEGPGDYLNCPMDEQRYVDFISALNSGEKVALKSFEDQKYFEGCLPIEVMAERGLETLRYGSMKPVGLPDPRTGKDPHAVVQLRKENIEGITYNMVGFQTKLTYPEQQRIFRMIPGMEEAHFERLGSIHRNTFINAPGLLRPTLQFINRPSLLVAGQLSGVEGYVESTAMGLLAGINAAKLAGGKDVIPPPQETAMGALVNHLTNTEVKHFQPSNINFGLFPPFKKKVTKKLRGKIRAEMALQKLEEWQKEMAL